MIAAAALTFAIGQTISCASVRVEDGDNFHCRPTNTQTTGGGREINVRLLGIDAPEMPGHCRRGRKCVAGDPFAARASLAAALKLGPVRFTVIGIDLYRRPDSIAFAGTVNLSCWQLARGAAVYVPRWDAGGRVRRACR